MTALRTAPPGQYYRCAIGIVPQFTWDAPKMIGILVWTFSERDENSLPCGDFHFRLSFDDQAIGAINVVTPVDWDQLRYREGLLNATLFSYATYGYGMLPMLIQEYGSGDIIFGPITTGTMRLDVPDPLQTALEDLIIGFVRPHRPRYVALGIKTEPDPDAATLLDDNCHDYGDEQQLEGGIHD